MDDQSNSNDLSLAVNELHALQQKQFPSEEGASSKLFCFPNTIEPIYNVNNHRSMNNNTQCLSPSSGLSVQVNSQYCSKVSSFNIGF